MKLLTLLLLTMLPILSFSQSLSIGEQTISYTDSSRNRPVTTEIWYPTSESDPSHLKKTDLPFVLEPTIRNAGFAQQKFPLIVLSHGTGANRFGLAWLAIALVKEGYIVAAPDHWGNTYDNKIPRYFVSYWERPRDISFMISQLLKDGRYAPYIDSNKIGMAGFSFGGYTTLALAGAEINCALLKSNSATPEGKKEFKIPEMGDLRKLINEISCEQVPSSFKDNRIKAFVALSPALGLGFNNKDQVKLIISPVLIIGAGNDQIAPLATNAENYHKLIEKSTYVTLEGNIAHYIFLNVGDAALKKEAKKYYQDDGVDRTAIHKKVEREVIEFFRGKL